MPSTSARCRPVTLATREWRARYYAFRHARDRVLADRASDAAEILDGEHGDYVRDRFRLLADDDDRFARVLALAREPLPPTDQRAEGDDTDCPVRSELAAIEAAIRRTPPAGFVATPPSVAGRMVDLAAIQPGERILEPSAGAGALIDAIIALCGDACIDAWEIAIPLREALIVKRRLVRFELAGSNFLDADRLPCQQRYDVVVMAPPFDDAARHVVHAWDHYLAPTGRIVALIDAPTLDRPDRLSRRLQSILATHSPAPDGLHIHGGMAGFAVRILQVHASRT